MLGVFIYLLLNTIFIFLARNIIKRRFAKTMTKTSDKIYTILVLFFFATPILIGLLLPKLKKG